MFLSPAGVLGAVRLVLVLTTYVIWRAETLGVDGGFTRMGNDSVSPRTFAGATSDAL